jgi:ribokinase
MGRSGSLTVGKGLEPFLQPAFDVEAIDTTGCGDVFHGGYIYGLLQSWPIKETVRFAAACAALKTRALGGRTAIPSLQEVEHFLLLQKEHSTLKSIS